MEVAMDIERVRERIMNRVVMVTESGCWIWTSQQKGAYGVVKIDRRVRKVHRMSWEVHYGPIPDGVFVCHHCDVPLCVRPDHLFLGTHSDNMKDCAKKGRLKRPENKDAMQARIEARRAQTHCKNGHLLAGENLRIQHGKYGPMRGCRTCINVWRREDYAKKRALTRST